MKTKIVQMAVFKNIRHDYLTTVEASMYADSLEHMRVSNVVDVEFQIMDSILEHEKQLNIDAAKERVDQAQKELDKLLGEK